MVCVPTSPTTTIHTSPTAMLVHSFRNSLSALSTFGCGGGGRTCGGSKSSDDLDDDAASDPIFENGRRRPFASPSSNKDNSDGGGFFRSIGGCSSSGDLAEVKMAVEEAMSGGVIINAAVRTLSCKGSALSEDANYSVDYNEDDQMRRLGSWGTFGTINTNESLDAATAVFDDDGNAIDPKIFEQHKRKRELVRKEPKRAVKFAYPPITSLKQCPRPQKEDLPQLFFTEEELDQYEADRRSTYIVDDVEIVAVSTSLSSDNVSERAPPSPSILNKFKEYVPSPQKKEAERIARGRQLMRSGRRTRRATPGPPPRETTTTSPKPKVDKRLLKSVQIFLRERSAG